MKQGLMPWRDEWDLSRGGGGGSRVWRFFFFNGGSADVIFSN